MMDAVFSLIFLFTETGNNNINDDDSLNKKFTFHRCLQMKVHVNWRDEKKDENWIYFFISGVLSPYFVFILSKSSFFLSWSIRLNAWK